MTLGQKRRLFARLLPRLVDHAHNLGFEVQVDEVKRGVQQAQWNASHCGKCQAARWDHPDADHAFSAIGSALSLHCDGLAVDLILFNGSNPIWRTERYAPLGEYWVGLDPLCAWGGEWGDGGHFSIQHRGMK